MSASGAIFYTLDGSDPRESPGTTAEGIKLYADPILLTQSITVTALAFNGEWSAMNQATYSVGPIVESLRVSELMYHPMDPNAEFIELTNIGTESINLNLVRFTNGIDFTFSPTDLESGQHVVVVKDLVTFESIYGEAPVVAGEYTGSLDNAGERIVLEDAAGSIILDFKYNDNWYDTTDGGGDSLTVLDPKTTEPSAWSAMHTWQPSLVSGGSPGQ
jgi:hypothetical protein